jgi:hypothetical protein
MARPAYSAAVMPAGPAPIMTTSYSCVVPNGASPCVVTGPGGPVSG